MNVNTALLRQFILEKFSADELTAFLFDYFREVYNDMSSRMPQNQRIQMLLEYCQNRDLYPDIFEALERERPGDFRRVDFSDMLEVVKASPKQQKSSIQRNPRQIFMSYAHQDKKIARQLANDLQAHGWDVWMAPDSIQPGEKWVEAINRGLAESGKVLLILTPDSAASTYVQDETNAAIEYKRHGEQIEILPLDVKHVPPAQLPFTWISLQRIPFSRNYKDGLENVLNTLQPDLMAQLNRQYDQLQQALGNKAWEKVQTMGHEILTQYPNYRETAQLMNMAQRGVKREAAKREEAGKRRQQQQAKPASKPLDDKLHKAEREQEPVKNYQDVDSLSSQKQQQEYNEIMSILRRVPVWIWLILLAPFAILGIWTVVFDNKGDETIIATQDATAIGEKLAHTPTSAVGLVNNLETTVPKTATSISTKTPVLTSTATSTLAPETPTMTPTNPITKTPVIQESVQSPIATQCPVPQLRVIYSSISIRSGPGTNYAEIDFAYAEDVLSIIAMTKDKSWYIVEYVEEYGWVSADVVELSGGDCQEIEVAVTIPASPFPTATHTPVPTDTATPYFSKSSSSNGDNNQPEPTKPHPP